MKRTSRSEDRFDALLRELARGRPDDDVLAHVEEGTLLGHYRIVSTLGKGGMGTVFLAEDTKLLRKVALKLLRFDGGLALGARGRPARSTRGRGGESSQRRLDLRSRRT